MTVSCSVTRLGSGELFCAGRVNIWVLKEIGIGGIKVGDPEKGKEGRSTGTVLRIEEARTGGEGGPENGSSRDLVLTAWTVGWVACVAWVEEGASVAELLAAAPLVPSGALPRAT